MSIHCEEVGGTGLAFLKGCNNEYHHINCYASVAYRNKSVLKAGERVDALSPVPTRIIIA